MTTHYPQGATRDGRAGKVSYRCRDPIVEKSFADYMHRHTFLSDGTRREPDNWTLGMNLTDDLDSLLRHVADLEALHAGYRVFKEKVNGEEITHYQKEPPLAAVTISKYGEMSQWREVDEIETLNAIRFNCGVYMLDYLKAKGK